MVYALTNDDNYYQHFWLKVTGQNLGKSIAIIGAGVVGLACARACANAGFRVVVLERESTFGTQTSSRNSGVIHAGIYYNPKSLKAKLCLEGNRMLYAYCDKYSIPFSKTGKLIVASSRGEMMQLSYIKKLAKKNGVMLKELEQKDAQLMEPELCVRQALLSIESGIIDVHELCSSLAVCVESMSDIVYNTDVDKLHRYPGGVIVRGISVEEEFELSCDYVINAAGHSAHHLSRSYSSNLPSPPDYLVKGNYFRIHGPAPFRRLIYPVPETDGLGIHYTINIGGFGYLGPNVEYTSQFDYAISSELEAIFKKRVSRYWPGINQRNISPDFSGFRPKITGNDFVIDYKDRIFTLLGIESPGLTSALAIAKYITALIENKN